MQCPRIVIRCTSMASAVAVLREELLREIWPSECQVGPMRGGSVCVCIRVCSGNPDMSMAPRAIMQSNQLIIYLLFPQDGSKTITAASASLQPSPAELEQISKAKLSLLLLWISLIHVGVFSLWVSWGYSMCALQHPSSCPFSSRVWGRGGWLQ